MDKIIAQINKGENLSFEEMVTFFDAMVNGKLTEAQIGAALVALRFKGENETDLAAAATVLNNYKIIFQTDRKNTIDTCGTGGDGKSTVNVSTIVSLTLASMGYYVVKHGNIAQSGRVGSADILEIAGIPTKLMDKEAQEFFEKNNMVFLFAQYYHPILKSVGKIRRELKIPTIFNYLGPMVNPADPDFQLLGINDVNKLDTYAKALVKLNKNNILVVSSKDGYDEISSSDITFARKVVNGKIEELTIEPNRFFKPFKMPVVKSSDEAEKLFYEAISGEDEKLNNIIAINTAYLLELIEKEEINILFEKVIHQLKTKKVKAYFEKLRSNSLCYQK